MTKTKKGNLKNCFTDSLSTQVIHDIDLKYKFRFFFFMFASYLEKDT